MNKETASKRFATHKKTNTRLFRIWQNMRRRCECGSHKEYSRYGGRGIGVCDEWKEFVPFYEWAIQNGYSDTLTIDRIDVNAGYSPANCQWLTRSENTKKAWRDRKNAQLQRMFT